jgi:hypothetical protein
MYVDIMLVIPWCDIFEFYPFASLAKRIAAVCVLDHDALHLTLSASLPSLHAQLVVGALVDLAFLSIDLRLACRLISQHLGEHGLAKGQVASHPDVEDHERDLVAVSSTKKLTVKPRHVIGKLGDEPIGEVATEGQALPVSRESAFPCDDAPEPIELRLDDDRPT